MPTPAQLKAIKKWNAKQFQLAIRIKPEIKQSIDAHIAITGESIAAFICRAVAEQIKRDNLDTKSDA